MNAYHETMTLPADTIDRLEELCRGPATDCGSDETVFDREVKFDDGCRMAIQVVAPSDPAESCWTQGVLFDADGTELGFTEPGDTFAGEYVVEAGGSVYATLVWEESRCSALLSAANFLDRLAVGGDVSPLGRARCADRAMSLRLLAKEIA